MVDLDVFGARLLILLPLQSSFAPFVFFMSHESTLSATTQLCPITTL